MLVIQESKASKTIRVNTITQLNLHVILHLINSLCKSISSAMMSYWSEDSQHDFLNKWNHQICFWSLFLRAWAGRFETGTYIFYKKLGISIRFDILSRNSTISTISVNSKRQIIQLLFYYSAYFMCLKQMLLTGNSSITYKINIILQRN